MKKIIWILLLAPLLMQGQGEEEVSRFSTGLFGSIYNKNRTVQTSIFFDSMFVSSIVPERETKRAIRAQFEYTLTERKYLGVNFEFGKNKRDNTYYDFNAELERKIIKSNIIGSQIYYKYYFRDLWKLNFYLQPSLSFLYENRKEVYSGTYIRDKLSIGGMFDLGVSYNVNKNIAIHFIMNFVDYRVIKYLKEENEDLKYLISFDMPLHQKMFLGVQYTFNKKGK